MSKREMTPAEMLEALRQKAPAIYRHIVGLIRSLIE